MCGCMHAGKGAPGSAPFYKADEKPALWMALLFMWNTKLSTGLFKHYNRCSSLSVTLTADQAPFLESMVEAEALADPYSLCSITLEADTSLCKRCIFKHNLQQPQHPAIISEKATKLSQLLVPTICMIKQRINRSYVCLRPCAHKY